MARGGVGGDFAQDGRHVVRLHGQDDDLALRHKQRLVTGGPHRPCAGEPRQAFVIVLVGDRALRGPQDARGKDAAQERLGHVPGPDEADRPVHLHDSSPHK